MMGPQTRTQPPLPLWTQAITAGRQPTLPSAWPRGLQHKQDLSHQNEQRDGGGDHLFPTPQRASTSPARRAGWWCST